MALEPEYVTDESLQQFFVNKDTGEPLANGYIYFFEDDNRNITKPVYELTGSPPNYEYAALPNPVRTSAVGTPVNSANEDVAIYLKPYDEDGNLQLYFVRVYDEDMTEQFTRQARPNIASSTNPLNDAGSGVTNELSNPTFSQVLFDSANNLVLNYTGSTVNGTYFDIAPDWQLRVIHSATGSVTVSRQAIAGDTGYSSNAPYTLTVSAATNATAVELIQRLNGTPALWSKHAASGGAGSGDGWVATSVSMANGSSVTVTYRPSVGTETTLLDATNISGQFDQFNNTVQIEPSDNTDGPAAGYVDIVIELEPGQSTVLSNIQVVGMASEELNVPFDQVPDSRNVDHLFHYYKPQLEYKPIPSHLVGWHFPSNPAQWGATFAVAGTGVKTSNYVWDQTLIYQSLDSGFSVARHATGALELTIAVVNTQVALVQYIEQEAARDILNDKIAVHIAANKSTGDDVNGLVSLWYTTDANLPDASAGTNLSIVDTLATNADVSATNGNWSQVPRRNGERAAFTLTSSTTENFNDIMLNGWDMEGIAAVGTATYMAIVVSFEAQALNDVIDFHSIALCSGDIATRPAPISPQSAISQCERYYEKSYRATDDPGDTTNDNKIIKNQNSYDDGVNFFFQNSSFSLDYRVQKWSQAPAVTLYSPGTGTADRVEAFIFDPGTPNTTSADINTNVWTITADDKNTNYQLLSNATVTGGTGVAAPSSGAGWIEFHYVVDSRLGIA